MNNTDKLLRAFIEASGYEIEEITESVEMPDKSRPEVGAMFTSKKVIDYKVTKKGKPDLIEAMGRSIDLMQAEFGCVEPDILTAFESAGWVNDEML